ncbi:hypothetical protein [Candidatus Nanohalobium constans]|uniref:Uncharacterized protein n=1 Tax=Candidatus Nanohalobium constans TaxID=2565781 RepID=A0A5Q0UEZ6_9ARCH|nr:hypothetical protein [Candidatus Nanohalobium constans]QGA80064.1 hypothetical protein LC1Nh_0156 [Candidatus Nanohalobium constans]
MSGQEIFDQEELEEVDRRSRYQNIPDSGSDLLGHDLDTYVQGKILVDDSETGDDFNIDKHFGNNSDFESLGLEPEGWEGEPSRSDILDAYHVLRRNPVAEDPFEILEAGVEQAPQFAGQVIYRTLKVAEAAREYERMRNSRAPDEAIRVGDVVWAFDEFSGIEMDYGGIEEDKEVVGNEAMQFISSTMVQNAYEKGVTGDTQVMLEETEDGNIGLIYESDLSSVENENGDIQGHDIFNYTPDAEEYNGLGLPVSAYITEKFGGDIEYNGDEDTFRIDFTFQTPE